MFTFTDNYQFATRKSMGLALRLL